MGTDSTRKWTNMNMLVPIVLATLAISAFAAMPLDSDEFLSQLASERPEVNDIELGVDAKTNGNRAGWQSASFGFIDNGWNLPGTPVRRQTLQQCIDVCEANASCKAFSYEMGRSTSDCWLKSSLTTRATGSTALRGGSHTSSAPSPHHQRRTPPLSRRALRPSTPPRCRPPPMSHHISRRTRPQSCRHQAQPVHLQ